MKTKRTEDCEIPGFRQNFFRNTGHKQQSWVLVVLCSSSPTALRISILLATLRSPRLIKGVEKQSVDENKNNRPVNPLVVLCTVHGLLFLPCVVATVASGSPCACTRLAATLSNCGNTLKFLVPNNQRKTIAAENKLWYGKNPKNEDICLKWAIRSQALREPTVPL